MKIVLLAAVMLAVSLASPTPAIVEPAAHDPKIEALVTDAYGAPPEFAADILLRIAGSARVSDPEWKQQLVFEAFLRAYAASESYRRTSSRIPADSRQGAALAAYQTGLNRATLQARAVQLMLTLAPARARELFEWMDVSPAAATCADPLVPAVDEYYTTLSDIARRTFRGARANAFQFLELYLWRAHLPSEMPAVVLAIQRFKPSTEESQQLEGFLDALFSAGSFDARGFSTANVDIVGRVADLQFFDRQRQIPGWFLMDTLRAYVVKHLAGPRCSDSGTEALLPATFDGALNLLHVGDTEVKRIEGAVISPSQTLPPAKIDLFWQQGNARRLYDAWLELRGRGSSPVPLAVRRTTEWRHAADDLITSVEHWDGRDTPNDGDYLFEKGTLFANIAELAPKGGAVRTRAVQEQLDFLRHEDRDRALRPLWFVFVDRLLQLSDREGGRGEVLDLMERSGDPVTALYARTDRLLPVGARKSDRQP